MIKENELISRVFLTIDQFKTLNQLKAAISKNEYNPYNSGNYSRVLVWKSCLITGSLNINEWDSHFHNTRAVFHQLAHRQDMKVPWSKLDEESSFYKSDLGRRKSRSASPTKVTSKQLKNNLSRTSASIDPLAPKLRTSTPSLNYEHTDEDVELLTTIIMDIDRLFPGDPFYANTNPLHLDHKKILIEVLYVWAKCNSNVGYKQGIHEIIGLLYMNLFAESITIPNTNSLSQQELSILNLYNSKYLLHDLFTIFNKFILESRIIDKFYETEDSLWKSIEYFNMKLMKIDQLIHYTLINKLKLESQLWIIRYLRLLLLRELGDLDTISLLWDKLIATSSSDNRIPVPEFIIFMIIQLLIQIKPDLITCDFAETISLLLHYPISNKTNNRRAKLEFINNLYTDALNLYERRDNDLQLYEYGIKLNAKYNPDVKVTISSSRSSVDSSNSKVSNQANDEMRFEKTRLEMRLKKKAQQMINK